MSHTLQIPTVNSYIIMCGTGSVVKHLYGQRLKVVGVHKFGVGLSAVHVEGVSVNIFCDEFYCVKGDK